MSKRNEATARRATYVPAPAARDWTTLTLAVLVAVLVVIFVSAAALMSQLGGV